MHSPPIHVLWLSAALSLVLLVVGGLLQVLIHQQVLGVQLGGTAEKDIEENQAVSREIAAGNAWHGNRLDPFCQERRRGFALMLNVH